MSTRLLTGDAIVMSDTLGAGSIGSCVSDPPYGLKFMGKAWDHGVPGVPYWEAVHRVLAPGAWLVAFGGTRTYHRLTCAIEDAGFELRDCLMWLYGSGFPKGKACLKPGWEPIVLARKPGPLRLNVDPCRLALGADVDLNQVQRQQHRHDGDENWRLKPGHEQAMYSPDGRWPANVVLSHETECREVGTKRVKGDPRGECNGRRPGGFANIGATSGTGTPNARVYGDQELTAFECVESCAVRMLDAQSGRLQSNSGVPFTRTTSKTRNTYGASPGDPTEPGYYGDAGGASRFYYCSKASTRERGQGNDHPTVKPLALMSWLVKLVTPPGGTVLDPFCGSGSTLIAADRLGFDAIGIDSDPHAIEIAQGRLTCDAGIFADVSA
jgi:hypothetical protein